MAANSKVNRMVGLALAATVAGSLTMAPAASAQTPTTTHAPVVDTPSSNSPASSAAETTPSTSHAPSSAPATSAVTPSTSVKAPVEGNGTGTADARYASNGWTYTALASNPKNQRVYAISEARDGHPHQAVPTAWLRRRDYVVATDATRARLKDTLRQRAGVDA